MIESIKEKRHPIICDICGAEMVFAKDAMVSTRDDIVFLEYVCPHREGEPGCGATKMVRFEKEVNAEFKRDKRNIFVRA